VAVCPSGPCIHLLPCYSDWRQEKYYYFHVGLREKRCEHKVQVSPTLGHFCSAAARGLTDICPSPNEYWIVYETQKKTIELTISRLSTVILFLKVFFIFKKLFLIFTH